MGVIYKVSTDEVQEPNPVEMTQHTMVGKTYHCGL